MIILLSIIGIIVTGMIIRRFKFDIGFSIVIGGFISLLGFLILLPFSRLESKSYIYEYYVIKKTINNSIKTDNSFENSSMLHQLIEVKKMVTEYQYWNETILDIFIDDEVMELKFINYIDKYETCDENEKPYGEDYRLNED